MQDLASMAIRALVSGFPGERRRNRGLLMLQAYIDASGVGNLKKVFVMAGYISTAERWERFSDEWQAALKGPGEPLRRFKMKEMKRDPDRCAAFYKLITKHALGAVSCVLRTDDLEAAVDSAWWKPYILHAEKLKNPYYFSFRAVMDVLSQNQASMGFHEPIDFVFDEDAEKMRSLEAWDYFEKTAPPEKRSRFGSTPIYRDDVTTMPLQAADLIAYWVREWEEQRATGVKDFKFPWREESFTHEWTPEHKDLLPWFSMKFSREDLSENLNRMMWQAAYRKKWSWLC